MFKTRDELIALCVGVPVTNEGLNWLVEERVMKDSWAPGFMSTGHTDEALAGGKTNCQFYVTGYLTHVVAEGYSRQPGARVPHFDATAELANFNDFAEVLHWVLAVWRAHGVPVQRL